jgi:hypothetical protein
MRLRHNRAPALLLLLPTLRVLAASTVTDAEEAQVARAVVPDYAGVSTIPTATPTSGIKATKDAPVDGLDGKPHAGPYIDDAPPADKKLPATVEDLRPEAAKPKPKPKPKPAKELTKEEWAALGGPENDGVMDDPNRSAPKGNTGTEGGVSAKDKDRKVQEDKTGEKAEQVPTPPKEAPPHPHGEQERLAGDNQDTETLTKKLGAQGLEVILSVSSVSSETDKRNRNPQTYPTRRTISHIQRRPPYLKAIH